MTFDFSKFFHESAPSKSPIIEVLLLSNGSTIKNEQQFLLEEAEALPFCVGDGEMVTGNKHFCSKNKCNLRGEFDFN